MQPVKYDWKNKTNFWMSRSKLNRVLTIIKLQQQTINLNLKTSSRVEKENVYINKFSYLLFFIAGLYDVHIIPLLI